MHILDQIAIKWKQERESFFLDAAFSNDYVNVETPVGKKHAWQVDKHEISKSKNLESIFEEQYRNETHNKIVPLFDMISTMFHSASFPPSNLDLATVILHPGVKFTDVISGIEGNFGNHGWIVSKRFLKILQDFNIGKYQEYQIVVKNKKETSNDYVYLHFISYADKFIEYPSSKFYTRKGGSLNGGSRELIDISSFEEIKKIRDILNKGFEWTDFDDITHILPKELFLKDNNLDLFKFKDIVTIECYMSAALAKKIVEENITGFELIRTTKVKNATANN
jgi:hypothetical protein